MLSEIDNLSAIIFPPTAYKFLPHLVCLSPTINKIEINIQIKITGGIGRPKIFHLMKLGFLTSLEQHQTQFHL